jgi:hypothetical protein
MVPFVILEVANLGRFLGQGEYGVLGLNQG